MKKAAVVLSVILGGCSTAHWMRAPVVDEAACTASCNAHYDQCPQVFAAFPERAAVECPAEHNNCLRACANGRAATPAAAVYPAMPPPAAADHPSAAVSANSDRAVASKEARLRELKHFHDEGLVSEDVYRDRQKAILAEP